jgi:hypothetical protein
MDTRVMLGRLLENMQAAHETQGAAIAALRSIILQLDTSGQVKVPPVRDMIAEALASNPGLTRAEIMQVSRRDYGVDLSPNTVTGTLARMRKERLVRRRGQLWFLNKGA